MRNKYIPYVGLGDTPGIIPEETLIRLSWLIGGVKMVRQKKMLSASFWLLLKVRG